MDPRQLQIRVMVLRGVLVAALAVLTGRLWSLQIAHWSAYDKAAEGRRLRVVWTPAPRGTICDRTGKVTLADNRIVYQIQVTPKELPNPKSRKDPNAAKDLNAAVVTLATVLSVSTVEVQKELDAARVLPTPDVVLPKLGANITRLQAIRLDEHRSEMPGIRVIEATQRYYPGGTLAAQVLGYARAINAADYAEAKDLTWPDPPTGPEGPLPGVEEKQKVYAEDSVFGKSGVERLCDRVRVGTHVIPALQGRRGVDEFEVDAFNTPRLLAHVPPVRGGTVFLTLDAHLQRATEQALADPYGAGEQHPPAGAAAVVVDVHSGEVLAMASYPLMDNNIWVGRMSEEEGNPPGQTNHAVGSPYPPGSTFKMISGCATLETTALNLGSTFHCSGRIVVGKNHEVKTCWKPPPGHGYVEFERAVAESCDVYFWEAVRQAGLSSDSIAAYAHKFGLGEPTGCNLPSEAEGSVPTAEWKRATKDERWQQGDTMNMVIGQGAVAATPAQMARVTAAIANGGTLVPLRVIDKIVWPKETAIPPVMWAQGETRPLGVKPSTLKAIQEGMRLSVTSDHGTGRLAMRGLPVNVASKTGSAETDAQHAPHAWFCCYAPYEHPQIAIVVLVENGGHGAEVSGSIARQILLAAFPAPAQVADAGAEGGPHA